MVLKVWRADSWRRCHISQQPRYENKGVLNRVGAELKAKPPVVDYREVDSLIDRIAAICKEGGGFIGVGDCAESIDANIEDSALLYNGMIEKICDLLQGISFVVVGRIAGQLGKPRSIEYEYKSGEFLPSYMGDMVNSYSFTPSARKGDPARLLRAYEYSVSKFKEISFLSKVGISYISHEALLLNYEESFTRMCNGKYYCLSAHMIWVGNRTRYLGSAHIEYVRGIANPVGIKLDAQVSAEHLVDMIRVLNPDNILGKIVLICRMGYYSVGGVLSCLVEAVRASSLNVLWVCDPMHGNTRVVGGLGKVRILSHLVGELRVFMDVMKKLGVKSLGLSLESTADGFSECVDDNYIGPRERESIVGSNSGFCDPRVSLGATLEFVSMIRGYF